MCKDIAFIKISNTYINREMTVISIASAYMHYMNKIVINSWFFNSNEFLLCTSIVFTL